MMPSPSPKYSWAYTVLEVLLAFIFIMASLDAFTFSHIDVYMSLVFFLIALIVFIIYILMPYAIEPEPKKPWVCGTPFIERELEPNARYHPAPVRLKGRKKKKMITITPATKCPHCGLDKRIRNPSGYCDHLYYPESCEVCQKLLKAQQEQYKKIQQMRSEKHVNKKGQRIWIHPFIKGDGELIQRDYVVDQPKTST